MISEKIRCLVLGGGGSKGGYEMGVLKRWMYEEKRDYDIIAGISVGALNAAMLCQVKKGDPAGSWEAAMSFWNRVSNKTIRKNWFLGPLSVLWKPSFYNSKPLQDWTKKELDLSKIQTSGRMLRVAAVSWETGESFIADENDPNLKDWVLASSSFPGMLSPILVNGKHWMDGGVRSVTPLGAAIAAGATEIDVIMCSDPFFPSPFEFKGKAVLPGLAMRAVEIMSNEISRADLKITQLKNEIPRYKNVTIRVIKPSVDLETIFGSSMNFDIDLKKMMDVGYQDAIKQSY